MKMICAPMDYHGSCGSSLGALEMTRIGQNILKKKNITILPSANTFKDFNIFRNKLKESLNSKEVKVIFGGNHLVLLPLLEKYSGIKTLFITFDAHVDLSDDSFRISHGNYLQQLNRIGNVHLLHIGNRIDKTYLELASKDLPISFLSAKQVSHMTPYTFSRKLHEMIVKLNPKVINLDIDLDVLDPIDFKSCTFKTPKGIRFPKFIKLLNNILDKYSLDCLSISEYNPTIEDKSSKGKLVCMFQEIFKRLK